MQYRQLGQSDLIVSRICFGCWQLSPTFWGQIPIEPWEAALRRAVEVGVNFLDTADAYGDGHAERCLGNFFKKSGQRDKFIVATKFYWNFQKQERFPDTTHDYILRECDASLQRMQTDRIDLYQIHAFDALTRPDEVAAALLRLRQEGKIRWIGVSNLNPEQMRMYGRWFEITSLQPVYNLIDRDVENAELPFCLTERIGVIPYSPLYRGLLTGKYAKDHTFTDARKNNRLFQGKAFARMLDGLNELKPIADGFGLTIPQLAIRWVLTHPAITAAIVGIKEPAHIESICPAAEGELPPEVWSKVASIIKTAETEAKGK